MRRWWEGLFLGVGLVGIPTLAMSEPHAALPQDFLSALQAVDTAYEGKDLEGLLSHYASNCTFIHVIPAFALEYKDAQNKTVKSKIKAVRKRHDVAWQRQELQQLFF